MRTEFWCTIGNATDWYINNDIIKMDLRRRVCCDDVNFPEKAH